MKRPISVMALLLACLVGLAATQTLSDLQRIDQAITLVKPIEATLSSAGKATFYQALSQLEALKAHVGTTDPVPDPDPNPDPDPDPVPDPDPDPDPEPEPEGPPPTQGHAYFEELASGDDVVKWFTFRNPDLLAGDARRTAPPLTYDPVEDATQFTLHKGGPTDTQQKHIPLKHAGSSLLLTWEYKIDSSMAFSNTGTPEQHKSFRLDDLSDDAWHTLKTNYRKGPGLGGVAELLWTMGGTEAVLDQSWRGSSETIQPALTRYAAPADEWMRVYWFMDGPIGEPDATNPLKGAIVKVSGWIATPSGIVQLLKEVPIYSDLGGVKNIRFGFDSSQPGPVLNEGKFWNRNFVALKGLAYDDVLTLIQRPQ